MSQPAETRPAESSEKALPSTGTFTTWWVVENVQWAELFFFFHAWFHKLARKIQVGISGGFWSSLINHIFIIIPTWTSTISMLPDTASQHLSTWAIRTALDHTGMIDLDPRPKDGSNSGQWEQARLANMPQVAYFRVYFVCMQINRSTGLLNMCRFSCWLSWHYSFSWLRGSFYQHKTFGLTRLICVSSAGKKNSCW